MKIFVLNCGSSSIKSYLYDVTNNNNISPIWEGIIQWKNHFDNPFMHIKNAQGRTLKEEIHAKNIDSALKNLLSFITKGEMAALNSLEEIDVIGHRIVHGGIFFTDSALITADVKKKIKELSKLAPLHNLPELEGIEILEKLIPKKPQIAVFDTAFHRSLPEKARIYPGPYQWYEEGIERYGFHGISFQYCSAKTSEMVKSEKMVICHLGSGSSLCAVINGKSIDTTMGFTPLDGLMMDTRPGSIDPGIVLYLLEKKSVNEISNELYQKSGLLGISGISSDMRDIIEKNKEKNPKAKLALDMYLHRLNALIGSMIASLKGLDAIVFTAGIGENVPSIRKSVCDNFSFLGIKLDDEKNQIYSTNDRIISTNDSNVKVLVIHTQEALQIAKECLKIKASLG